MGNYRFKLSDMMPNAWFYKLKEMGKTRNIPANSVKKKHPRTPAATSLNPHQSSKTYKTNQNYSSYPRKSYHFTRQLASNDQKLPNSPVNMKISDNHFPDPPRKSTRRRSIKKKATVKYSSPKLVTSSVSSDCNCRTKPTDSPPDYSASSSDSSREESSEFYEEDSFPPEFRSDSVLATDSFDTMFVSDGGIDDDIIIDVEKKSIKFDKLEISDLDLPPIITKPGKCEDVDSIVIKKETTKTKKTLTNKQESVAPPSVKESKNGSTIKRHSMNSPGVRLRVNSPRIVGGNGRRISQNGRKSISSSNSSSSSRKSVSRRSLSESLAIVKSSFDPQKDFRESMVEMIVENNIRASTDLEDLLACYLSLNSDEYHDIIIKVFKQIWFDLTDTPISK